MKFYLFTPSTGNKFRVGSNGCGAAVAAGTDEAEARQNLANHAAGRTAPGGIDITALDAAVEIDGSTVKAAIFQGRLHV